MDERLVGIDLGTSYSTLAVVKGSQCQIIPNQEGELRTPSIATVTENGETIVGEPARRHAITRPRHTMRLAKRLVGRGPRAGSGPFQPLRNGHGDSDDGLRELESTSPEICSLILRKLKQAAESHCGREIKGAVITVPASSGYKYRRGVEQAARIAGLNRLRLISSTAAAGLAYSWKRINDETICIFDLGGGTLDVAILVLVDETVQVLSTNGDMHLGGVDFDEVLVNFIAKAFLRETGVELRGDPVAVERLREAAEWAKIDLSQRQQTEIIIPFIAVDVHAAKDLRITVTRAEFEALIADSLERCRRPVEQALRDAHFSCEDIEQVVLVGGSTRIPRVREFARELFKGKALCQRINTDESVLFGAAIQGGILAGEIKDGLVLDATPLSLGIETEGGVMTVLIERNATFPVEKKDVFSTPFDNQTMVTISIYEGERKMAADNCLLGQFNLEGIRPAPRGNAQIEIRYNISVDGILTVFARELTSGVEQSLRISFDKLATHNAARTCPPALSELNCESDGQA